VTAYALSAQQRRSWLRDAAPRWSSCRFLLPRAATLDELHDAVRTIAGRHAILRADLRRVEGRHFPLLQIGETAALEIVLDGAVAELRASTFHCDAASMLLLANAIAAIVAGEAAPAAADHAYLQFAKWQDEVLETPEEAERAYWLSRREDLALCAAPIVTPAPHVPVTSAWQTIPVALDDRFLDAAKRLDASPALLALACWSTLIARNRGRDEIVLGVTLDGRGYAPFAPIVGPIARTLPLRIGVASTPKALVDELHARLAELAEHEETFDWGVEPDDVVRFPAGFRSFCIPEGAAHVEQLFDADDAASLFCSVTEAPGRLRVQLDFDTRACDRRSLLPVARQLETLLRHVAHDATAPFPRSIVHEEDRMRARIGLEGTDVPRSVAERFREQAARLPQHAALVDDATTVTYAELEAWADGLAEQIRAHDTGRVALLFEPGAPMIAAMLGCVLAGKPYVPLDPQDPPSRHTFILQDAEAGLILTSLSMAARCDPSGGQAILPVQSRPERRTGRIASPPPGPDAAVYVIYTSGTTGRPKGVAVPSRALANYAAWAGETLRITEADRGALVTSASYDLGYTTLWGMLLNGGTLYVPSDASIGDPPRLLAELQARAITFLKVTPSLLHLYLDAGLGGLAPSLRMVVTGGEAIRPADLERLHALAPQLTIVNHYGPTETTIGCIAQPIAPNELAAFCRHPVLGRPITNATVCIVDADGAPVIPGVVGEICVGGAGLSLGYPRDPELTAARFVALDGIGRVYRTGDLGYQDADGRIAFLGRADAQLKIRGYRVEPDEVARVLAGHEGIDDVAVSTAGADALVAFCVPSETTAGVVRRLCRLAAGNEWMELVDGEPLLRLNQAEATFLHREIFVEQMYLRHGVSVADGDVVVDVGANIGMFAAQVALRAPSARIVAIEPARSAFETLRRNAALYGGRWTCVQAALGAESGHARLTVYRDHSLLATLRPRPDEDRELLYAMAEGRHGAISARLRIELQEAIDEQMQSAEEECAVRTLSRIIDEHALPRVDLLKIDAQRAELDILRGIEAEHWPRIRQIVLETDAGSAALEQIAELLRGHGFSLQVEGGGGQGAHARVLVYAVRGGGNGRTAVSARKEWRSPRRLVESLKQRAADALPLHARPSRYVLVDRLPLNANGKLSAEALAADHAAGLEITEVVTEPPTELGRALAALWRTALGVENVGLESHFFELGGQSLLAARLTNAIRERLSAHVTMAEVLRNARFSDLLELVESRVVQTAAALAPAPWGDVYPLSHLQRRIWFVCQLDGGSEAYNVSRAFRIRGPLDSALLQRALAAVAARHDALRTCFEPAMMQRVRPADACVPPVIETTAKPAPYLALADDEAARPFDLTRDVLLRALLVHFDGDRFDGDESLLVLTTHHLIVDGWSVEILLRELFAAYADLRRGLPPLSAEQLRPQKDFVHALNALSAEALERAGDYLSRWSRKSVAQPALPPDFERERPAFHGRSIDVAVPEELHRAVDALAARLRVSPFAVCLAALEGVLHRATGAADVVVATTVAGRDLPGAAQQIGCFANTLLLDAHFDPDDTWEVLVRRAGASVVEALEHQHLSLDEIVSRVRAPRRHGMSGLASVGITWYELDERARLDLAASCGFTCDPLESDRHGARADLWFFAEVSERLRWTIIYNEALFRRERIEALAEGLLRALEQMTANPADPIAAAPAGPLWTDADLDFELSL
jgi:amino acid adenylation domain-containing protein/FkbM family methyltransferase